MATLPPMTHDAETARRNLRVGAMAFMGAVLMLGLGYAAVPLYEMFCRVTGFGGTTQVASESDAARAAATKGPAAAVSVRDCWVRHLPANLPSAAYFVIVNDGDRAVEVTGASSPAYGSVMMHATVSKGGMASMAMAPAIKIAAHETFAFRPGGHHVMLEQPTAPPVVGTQVPLMLVLADGHSVQASCIVKPAGAAGP